MEMGIFVLEILFIQRVAAVNANAAPCLLNVLVLDVGDAYVRLLFLSVC